MSLDVEGLTVTDASGHAVVDEANWSVAAGGRLGIIGESGSGKSMTALAIMGLLPDGLHASGSVHLGGQEILGLPERELQRIRGHRIAMVFQEPLTALDPLMRVGKQVAEPLRLRGVRKKNQLHTKVSELLDMVAITDIDRVMQSYPWELSGGQRQRIALAMALANEPEVLIADEPTTALDVTVQAEILALLQRLVAQTGTTLVFISHDLPVVSTVADQIVVMQRGRIVESGGTQQILRKPSAPYTQTLLTAARNVNRVRVSND